MTARWHCFPDKKSPGDFPPGLLISDRWAPARLIARRKPVPLLVLHGEKDPVVPYSQGRRLFDLAPGPKEFWKIDGDGHTEAFYGKAEKYRRPVLEWLERALAD